MKRCPECRRDYYDDTLLYCLDDGNVLLDGPGGGAITAFLPQGEVPSEAATKQLDPADDPVPSKRETAADASSKFSARRNKLPAIALAVVVVILGVVGIYKYYLSGNSRSIESIAVMPFTNESGNADVEYLSDGMTESLTNSLSQLANLKVKARSSAFRYKGKETDPQTIGRELNVQALLNGRVVQHGDDLTLYLSLVDAKTENQLWGKQYNRKLINLVVLQTEIARDVSENLRTKLSGTDERRLAKNYTADTEAYQLYLKGRYHWNKRTEEGLKKAIEYFNQAIEKDPNYALAFSGLADCYNLFPGYGGLSPEQAFPQARVAASKALAIDDTLAEAHTSLAFVRSNFDWDWGGAETEYKRALDLNRNYPAAHQWYANFLRTFGRFDEALSEYKIALELDPFIKNIDWNIGFTFYSARRYDEAIGHFQSMLRDDSKEPSAYYGLGLAYEQKGRPEEAVTALQTAIKLSPDFRPHYLTALGSRVCRKWAPRGSARNRR